MNRNSESMKTSSNPAGRIAVFASGNGSNAENIIRYFREADRGAQVALVVTNKAEAGVIGRAESLGVETCVLPADRLRDPDTILPLLEARGVDLIVLAGFLLMVPPFLIARYPGRIINIHPSLLPAYGGKGMYGRRVHEAVVEAGESRTGITVHFVSEKYDEGRIIAQIPVEISPSDSAADVESKIHRLEKEHFPRIIHETFYNNKEQ
ncbi:phosphoribosylglycinamide formyltransferase [Duncaniella muris]|uniref:phosphoribosylglycinamide formyltransferase n=2 Tax=Duncaniella muris TaxID=2094150 RepID=UPI000AB49642|nr:phosphoribosylglycinamide formyltransferase [Duncaniella muris]